MDTTLSRRSLIGRTAGVTGLVLAGDVSGILGAGHTASAAGYGPLLADPAKLLALPDGFRYTVVARAGATRLESGEPTPGLADGTASFKRAGGGSTLVVNHEIEPEDVEEEDVAPVPLLEGFVYDEAAPGGTTTLEVDADGRRIAERVSLAGTLNNCAGGTTPWATWLTCEEASDTLGEPHGYVFEVDPRDQANNRNPRPIKALGRFEHESVVVDPRSGRLYMTEDAEEPYGLLYRWTPPDRFGKLGPGRLRELGDDAGRLHALRAFDRRGRLVPDLSEATRPGTTYRVGWAVVGDRDASGRDTRLQFDDDAITRSQKLEGMWWGDGGVYFTASYARAEEGSARNHDGQVWFLDPRRRTLELRLWFAFTPQEDDVDGPDNITVSPFGGVIMAEDGEGAQHLVGANRRGRTFFLARNEAGDSEFTGPNLSPDKRFLFANVQDPGTVFAITGPFRGRG